MVLRRSGLVVRNSLAGGLVASALFGCANLQPPPPDQPASAPAAPVATANAPAPAPAPAPASSDGGVAGALGALGSVAGSMGVGSGMESKIGAVTDLVQAVTITDSDVIAQSMRFRAADDKRAKIAPANNKYAQRLKRLTDPHLNEDGLKFNFKAVLSPAVNANATPDGSIRVYSGLMDLMTDDELRAIIGHEIGHVLLGHRLQKTRAALLASAARKGVASTSGVAGRLADSQLGEIGEATFKGQFSQSAETEADDYGLQFLQRHKYNLKAMETGFRKLAKLGGTQRGLQALTSSHPDSAARADRARDIAGSMR
jgi:metalloprotease